MLQHHKYTIVHGAKDLIEILESIVSEKLLNLADIPYEGVFCQYSDEWDSIDFSIFCRQGEDRPSLLIEISTDNGVYRIVKGFFSSFWNLDERRVEEVRAIQVNRLPATISQFCEILQQYSALPYVHFEQS